MKNRVRELREERKLTQLQLALKVDTSQNTISQIEMGNCNIKAELLIKLASFFDVSTDFILCLSNERRRVEAYAEIQKTARYDGLIRPFNKLDEYDKNMVINLVKQLAAKKE